MRFKTFFASGLFFVLFLLLSFPLFYFVYKFGDPEPLAHDFFQYYHLYQRMDVWHVISPHNMRVVGAFFIYLFYKANLFFDTASGFDRYGAWGFMKQVYFSAVVMNTIFVAMTCVVIFSLIKRELKDNLMAFVAGMVYLLGFGTLFYCIMPLTEAFSILLFTLFLSYYRRQKYAAIFFIFLLIFQREYLLICIATISALDWSRRRQKYNLKILSYSVLAFIAYYALRRTIFYNPALDYQSDLSFMMQSLVNSNLDKTQYLRQLLLGMNLVFIYLFLIAYKRYHKQKVDLHAFLTLMILLFEVNVISIAGGHGNNVGRYFYLVIPYLIVTLIYEVYTLLGMKVPLENSEENNQIHDEILIPVPEININENLNKTEKN